MKLVAVAAAAASRHRDGGHLSSPLSPLLRLQHRPRKQYRILNRTGIHYASGGGGGGVAMERRTRTRIVLVVVVYDCVLLGRVAWLWLWLCVFGGGCGRGVG